MIITKGNVITSADLKEPNLMEMVFSNKDEIQGSLPSSQEYQVIFEIRIVFDKAFSPIIAQKKTNSKSHDEL